MIKKNQPFDKTTYPWNKNTNYRSHPELYRIGKGEQGVLICEPYKSEILPFWKFKTPQIAQKGAQAIYALFLGYLNRGEFAGADMARKFLQMGFTRARRYTNYKGGRKYLPEEEGTFLMGSGDPTKAECASIYYSFWQKAKNHPEYAAKKQDWKKKYG